MTTVKQVSRLIRSDVFEMDAYTPIVPFEVLCAQLGLPADQIIKVDANENPYGPSPKVAEALSSYPYYHIYPDPNHTVLREALERGLRGMDSTALSLCMDNRLPILVFNMSVPENVRRVLRGERIGTSVVCD